MAGYDPKASARALAMNRRASWLYACAFGGLILIFVLANFGRSLFQLQTRRGTLAKSLAAPFRAFRQVFLRKLPKVSSGGHLLLILVYCGLNAAITFYDVGFEGKSPYSLFAKRCGWLAVCNAALAFLLSMKNTPLAYMTGIYTATLTMSHNLKKMREDEMIYGWVAFVAFNIIYASSLQFIRRRFYEAFYLIHVVMFVVSVVFLGLHKPQKFGQAMIGVGIFWCFDRLIRTARLIYYSFNNKATLVPLSGLATKVIFEKPINCQPGSHAFISIPSIRKLQSHPFTISSSDRIEFVIRAQKGFTLDLHKHALKNPYKQIKAYIDGPYGAVPDFKRMNKVVLFAGGSGGAFSFPIAIDIIRNIDRIAVTHMEFVWVIRDERHLTWYEEEIKELTQCPIVNLSIYVSSKTDPIVTSQPVEEATAVENDVRRSLYLDLDGDETEPSTPDEDAIETSSDPIAEALEKELGFGKDHIEALQKELGIGTLGTQEELVRDKRISKRLSQRYSANLEAQIDQRPMSYIETMSGRPDLTALIKGIVKNAEQRDTVAVGACGPTELMRVARNAVADSITLTGPSVTLHCEQFGWG
ncbi:uncharacterized protein H6S33_003802 [Morchella sextelata]|uniref:uncharacterized protein n=1 Tax=Morchella sextelata TaxID=1174677 RepID=UPI001D0454FF|nr:uncharacterized protein H6S33_003802 [Morchella sextelata]KAH0606141.1 hypothetical protein H6S33_003802 [Morchella sextelata]